MIDNGYPKTTAGWSTTTVWWTGCRWCGCVRSNNGICPRVRAIEYYPDGSVKRVEFHEAQPAIKLDFKLNQVSDRINACLIT